MSVADKKRSRVFRAKGELAHSGGTAALSAISYFGGLATEIYERVIRSPLERRRDEWMNNVGEGLRILEEKVQSFSLENLAGDEGFLSALVRAGQIANATH